MYSPPSNNFCVPCDALAPMVTQVMPSTSELDVRSHGAVEDDDTFLHALRYSLIYFVCELHEPALPWILYNGWLAEASGTRCLCSTYLSSLGSDSQRQPTATSKPDW